MAALGTYYYSSVSFSTAVALYTDAALSVFAPDGWYSDESIYRQQASGILFASTTCPSCGSPAPPVPTPVTYDYREYTECGGVATQVFRVPSGGSWPASVEYDSKCWETPIVTGSTSTINIGGLPSYADCATCAGVPSPTPTPTPVPVITYDYEEYTECSGSSTRIFRLVSGGSFPAVLADAGICWENGTPTSTTSTNDAAGLTDYLTCGACSAPPVPVPVPVPVPTPASGTELFSTNSVGNGESSSSAACALQTSHSIYTSRANVASIIQGDILYTNASLTNVWNGGLKYYGVTDVTAKYPDVDSGYAFLITAAGVVDDVPVDCTPAQDIEIQECGTITPRYKVRTSGTSGYTLNQALKITGAALGPNPEFTGTDCWEIVDVVASSYDSTVTVNSAALNCTACLPSTQDVEIRECGTTTPTYKIQVSTTGLAVGEAIKITGAASAPNPEFTGVDCWEIIDDAASSYDSSVTLNATDSSCSGCLPPPTYDYAEYTECFTSTTQIFRKLTTTSSWPIVLEYNVGGYDLCFSDQQPTTGTSTVSIEALTNHVNCFDCEAPTTYVNATPGNGWVESTACNYATSDYIFTSRASVGLIQTGDIMYANSSLSTIFNGALDWYGVSNVLGQVTPDYKLLINSLGVVDAVVSCTAPTPTPTPTPVPVATTNVRIEDCNDSSIHAYVTLAGTYGPSSPGLALKISAPSGPGTCISGFDGTKCWEIVAVGTASDCSVTTLEVNTDCASCTPTPPTPTPTPTPTPVPVTPTPTPTPVPTTSNYYYTITRCDGGVDAYTETVSTIVLYTGEAVLMPDNYCYEIVDVPASINSNAYTSAHADCATCNASITPTPTPTPTPVPTPTPTPTPTPVPVAGCYGITGAQGITSSAACASSRTETLYFDSSDFCTATVYYGNIPSCTTVYSSSTYVSVGGHERYWNGSAFTYYCTGCP